MRFRDGEAEAPLAVGEAARDRSGTEITFLPSDADLHQHRVRFRHPGAPLRELAFLNSGVTLRLIDDRHAEAKAVELHYEGGLEPSCATSTGPRPR